MALRADKRTKQVASKARELFPEVAAPDYAPKVKKKGKKVCFIYTHARTHTRASTPWSVPEAQKCRSSPVSNPELSKDGPNADQKCNISVTIFSKLSIRVFCLYKQVQFCLFVCFLQYDDPVTAAKDKNVNVLLYSRRANRPLRRSN